MSISDSVFKISDFVSRATSANVYLLFYCLESVHNDVRIYNIIQKSQISISIIIKICILIINELSIIYL